MLCVRRKEVIGKLRPVGNVCGQFFRFSRWDDRLGAPTKCGDVYSFELVQMERLDVFVVLVSHLEILKAILD